MKKVVWKYELTPGQTHLQIPLGAELLDMAMQGDKAFMWFLVLAPEERIKKIDESRLFQLVQTGEEFDSSNRKYLGTIHDHTTVEQIDHYKSINYVWHIFEVAEG